MEFFFANNLEYPIKDWPEIRIKRPATGIAILWGGGRKMKTIGEQSGKWLWELNNRLIIGSGKEVQYRFCQVRSDEMMINKKPCLIIIFCVLAILNAAVAGADEFSKYTEYAANWLIHIAHEDNVGMRWPYHEGKDDMFSTSFYMGSAGVCYYFLNLYNVTGREVYLEAAKKAADHLIADSFTNKVGFSWQNVDEQYDGSRYHLVSPGLYLGAAGIGDVFLALYQVVSNPDYLKYATGAADWILSLAKMPYTAYPWGGGTDIISGGAGIGLFLLRVHEVTDESQYLAGAIEVGDWLIAQAVKDGDGLKWRPSAAMGCYYAGFAHGTAGVAYYLLELYQATHEQKYLATAEAAARWLKSRAKVSGKGLKWFRREPDQKSEFMNGWCNGATGIGRFFLRLYQMTGKPEYLDVAEKGATWVRHTIYPVDQNMRTNACSMCCGASGAGDYFLDLYIITKNADYLNFALKLGKSIVRASVKQKDRYKWLHMIDKRGKSQYASGFMQGAAGIGYYLLRLHAIQSDRESLLIPFADRDLFAKKSRSGRSLSQ